MNDAKDPKAVPQISIDALAQAFAAAMKDNRPTAGMLTGMSEERLERVQGKHEKPLKYRHIAGKSSITGSTFMMVVLESRAHKHGRVVRLENYRVPPGAYVPISQGGLMPEMDAKQIFVSGSGILNEETPKSTLTKHYKYWLVTEFWHRDLREICNGAPLRPENCVDGPKALDTPWETSNLFEEQAAE